MAYRAKGHAVELVTEPAGDVPRVEPIALCDSAERAEWLAKLLNSHADIRTAMKAGADLMTSAAAAVKVGASAVAAVRHADDCFEAALAEGWLDAIQQGFVESIRDLWDRRLSKARDLFPAALRGLAPK